MVTKPDTTQQARCTRCGSTEVSKAAYSRRAMAWCILLLGFPFLFFWKERHCFDCGTDFRAS